MLHHYLPVVPDVASSSDPGPSTFPPLSVAVDVAMDVVGESAGRRTSGAEAGIPSRRRACLGAGQGQVSRWSTACDERPGHLPLVCYASGADVMGYRATLVTHRLRAQPGDYPGAEARRRHLCFGLWEPYGAALVDALACGRRWSRVTPDGRY